MANTATKGGVLDVQKEFTRIREHAETICNDDTHTLGELSPGDCWAQGDLVLMKLDRVPDGATKIPAQQQLVPGNTQGSRHCLTSLEGITMHKLADATELDGPVFEAEKTVEIDHPEHGNVIGGPGVYGVIYQRQRAEELRRVRD